MSLTGKIMDFFADKAMTTPAFPRTKVKAVSDDNGVGLEVLLDNKAEKNHTHTTSDVGAAEKNHTHTVDDVSGTLPITKGGTGATNAADALIGLGLTATATELNYMDGVTSNVQTQINKRQIATITTGSADDIYEYLTLRDIRTNNDELYNLFRPSHDTSKSENSAYIVTLFLGSIDSGSSRIQIAVGYVHGYVATRSYYYYNDTWSPWVMQMGSILHPYFTGSSLPAAGTKNRIFFKTE